MVIMRRRKLMKRISLITAQLCLAAFIIVFIIIPIVFSYSITLQRGVLFLTFISYPKNLDFKNPSSVGLLGTRNFYLKVNDIDDCSKDGIKIGVWHILPINYVKRFVNELSLNESFELIRNSTNINDEIFEKMEGILKSEFPVVTDYNEELFYERLLKLPGTVILYLHGNTASRGSGHRIEMYNVLRKLGYHVISFDYRGYGDSDKQVPPTEEGVVRDAITVYKYISNRTTNPVILWGHSLGTGVSTHMLAQLNSMNESGPRAVILESPFTNIREEIRKHPFAKPFKYLPWFDMTISQPMYLNSLRFESDQHISEFRQPVMILHAEDDYVVPFQLGYKLFRTALDNRAKSWGPVQFHNFKESFNYGHKYLCRAPELPNLIKEFVENYRNESY